MGHRPHIYVRRLVSADPGKSPNAYVPQITVEIRAFWPALEKHRVAAILADAYAEALAALDEEGKQP